MRRFDPWFFVLLAAIAAILIFLLIILSRPSYGAVEFSPLVYEECLNRDVIADLTAAGAHEWELRAARAITRDGASKGPVDTIWVSDDELAVGIFHFTAQRDRFELNVSPTPSAYHPLLYSEEAGRLQLSAWRRIVRPAVRAAQRAGLRDRDLALIAAVANSSPVLAQRIGRQCDWNTRCISATYAKGSDHRARRVHFLEGLR